MEKIYIINKYEEGDLITQDGALLTTQGVFVTIDLITQNGHTLLTQAGDILQGRIFDDISVDNIGYRTIINIDRFVDYIDINKENQVTLSKKTYNPTITEKIYGN